MEGLASVQGYGSQGLSISSLYASEAPASLNQTVVETVLTPAANQGSDSVSTSFSDLYKNLSITQRQVVDKLNELLKGDLPDGIQSLKPEDVTPEATADRIVQGATSFFDVYAKQNPDLEGGELLDKFMETIRGGIESGYGDASRTLEDLGAFEFDGVKSGIEKTKSLVDEKLKAYETEMRKKLGLDTTGVSAAAAESTKTALLESAGAKTLNIAA